MTIQQLAPDPSPLSRLLGAVGQGLGKSIPDAMESRALEDILSREDFTKDPQSFITALMGAPVSRQAKQDVFGGIGALQSLELGQQNIELRREGQEIKRKKLKISEQGRYEDSIRNVASDLGLGSDKLDWLMNATGGARTYEDIAPIAKRKLQQIDSLKSGYFDLVRKMQKEGTTTASKKRASKMARELIAYDEGELYQGLEDIGLTEVSDQLKYISVIPGDVKDLLKTVLKRPSIYHGVPSGVGQAKKMSARIKQVSNSLMPHINPSFPVGLVVQDLQKKGYDEEDILKIFEPFTEQLTARQKEELTKVTKKTLGETFKGLFRRE